MRADAGGRIITFYSYKGGTGRSMALANVAWILASNGLRVLALDWDLEAPGLHRYFHPFLVDKELASSPGIIDFVVDFAAAAMSRNDTEDESPDWYRPYANLLRNAVSLDWPFPAPGTLDFVPAGRQDSAYAVRVNSFHWQQFYDKLGGGVFLEAVKARLRQEYDYILVDSRTGVSDTSGVCTVQMPDQLVVCFTLNQQSIEGASAAANSALAQRRRPDGSPGLVVWPVPMRVEMFEKQKLEIARDVARQRFDDFLWMLSPAQRSYYWGSLEVPYQPYYAYEEVLATFADRPGHTNSLLASMERLAYCLTTGAVNAMQPVTDEQRAYALALYSRRRSAPVAEGHERTDFLYAIVCAEGDFDDSVIRFHQDLLSEIRTRTGDSELQGFLAKRLADPGSWAFEIEPQLRDSRVLICLMTPSYLVRTQSVREVNLFIERRKPVVPIPWIATRGGAPRELQELLFHQESLPARYGTGDVRDLVRLEKHADNYRSFLAQMWTRISRLSQKSQEVPIDSTALSVLFCIVAAEPEEAKQIPGSADLYAGVDSWSPFTNGYRSAIGDTLRRIAVDYRLSMDILSAEAVVEQADQRPLHSATVNIIDVWSLTLPRYAEVLRELKRRTHAHTARIYCVDLGGERNQERHRLRELLNIGDSDVNAYYVYDYESLEETILSALSALSTEAWQP